MERELKLDVPENFVLPSLDGVAELRAHPAGLRVQASTYWDTADHRLLVNGVGLRWRSDWGWTCKSEAGGLQGDLLAREEHSVAGPPDAPPAELTRPLERILAGLRLVPSVRISTHRTAIELRDRDGTPRVELVDDRVRVLDGPRQGHAWRELELELREAAITSGGDQGAPAQPGDQALLGALVARLREAGAGAVVGVAKHLRALGVDTRLDAGSLAAHQAAGRIAEQLDSGVTRAAGGVVLKGRSGGEPRELVVVHRPRYDDWCLPKGKADAGETLEATALREVAEETGLHCAAVMPLGCVSHALGDGATKTVWWWTMRVVEGDLRASEETDRVAWLSVEAARERLTHAGERALLERLL